MTTSISKHNGGMAANLKHIVAHGVRDNPVPLGPTAVTRGFEKTAFPKIVGAEIGSVCKRSLFTMTSASLISLQKTGI